jgi:carbamoyl-phosphate synthase large subunit
MEVVQDEEMLQQYIQAAVELSPERPILIDRFLDNAIEAEADAIADGAGAFVPAVMEHIELAGIHSGDSACVIPPISIAPRHIDTISEYTRKIAVALNVVGLMNVQYAIFENTVYVLEANPRASRTVPIVSKVCGISMARLATRVMLGAKIDELDLVPRPIAHYGVKEAVFPFNMFPEVDPILGPEMRSTGEVLGLSHSFGRAFFKAQEATQVTLPLDGTVLFTIADRDKKAALEPVRRFRDLGFGIMATPGTHAFLKDSGIEAERVQKLGYGRPDLVDAIKNGEVQLLVNTPSGRQSAQHSSEVRKAAIKYKIPYITTTAAAIAAAKGIAARRQGAPKVRSLQAYLKV